MFNDSMTFEDYKTLFSDIDLPLTIQFICFKLLKYNFIEFKNIPVKREQLINLAIDEENKTFNNIILIVWMYIISCTDIPKHKGEQEKLKWLYENLNCKLLEKILFENLI